MILLRIVLVFCGVAVLLAATGDLLLRVLVQASGGVGVFASSEHALNRIPAIAFSALWVLALLIGWVIVRKFGLVPRF